MPLTIAINSIQLTYGPLCGALRGKVVSCYYSVQCFVQHWNRTLGQSGWTEFAMNVTKGTSKNRYENYPNLLDARSAVVPGKGGQHSLWIAGGPRSTRIIFANLRNSIIVDIDENNDLSFSEGPELAYKNGRGVFFSATCIARGREPVYYFIGSWRKPWVFAFNWTNQSWSELPDLNKAR